MASIERDAHRICSTRRSKRLQDGFADQAVPLHIEMAAAAERERTQWIPV